MGPGAQIALAIVVLIIVILIGLAVYFHEDIVNLINCAADPATCASNAAADIAGKVIGKPLECPPDRVDIGALCREKCKENEDSDNIANCYTKCPADWKGKSTLTHCNKDTIYSTAGKDGLRKECPPGTVRYADLCYTLPDSTWEVTSPGLIGKKCPRGTATASFCTYDRGAGRIPDKAACSPGLRDDGTSCWEDWKCSGGWDYWGGSGACWDGWSWSWKNNCYRAWNAFKNCGGCGCIKTTLMQRQQCRADEEMKDGLCYKKCDPGFTGAVTMCSMNRQTTSKVGKVPDLCPSGKVKGPGGFDNICYPTCPPNYERTADNVEFCSSVCPPGFKNIGIGGCERPKRGVNTKGKIEVGVCPPGHMRSGDWCKEEKK